MKRYRRHRIAVRRADQRVADTARRSPARLALSLSFLAVLPATLQAGSPINHSFGDLNAHLQSHGAAVRHANAPAQTGGHHDPNVVLNMARQYLSLRLDLPVTYEPGGGPSSGGLGGRSSGLGGDLTTDLFVQQQVAIDNWAPGGVNFPGAFDDRGTLIAQDGNVVITPTSSWQIGNFNLQTAAINGQYSFINDINAPHGANVHAPFDVTSSASGSADTTTDTSEVRVDLQWVGTYNHPEEAYDPPQGGGYDPPIGALDFFTFDIQGNAAAQYFNPTGAGGSNQPPGLPELPKLPPLPEFNNNTLPNELTGLNPYGPSYNSSSNTNPYNPYNPTTHTNPNYNPYNPTTHTNPNYNPYNPSSGNNNGYNPYLASSPYNASGAPDNSALLAALGGSASNVNNQSQFDHTWLTEIEQAQGVQHYQDYGSFSSANSAAFRGIVRPVQLTAVNQQELAAYIAATGNIPSTIATQVNVLDGTPGGVTSFASLDDYDERKNGNNQQQSPPNLSDGNPFGYNTFAGSNQGSNASREQSYQGSGNTESSAPPGYNTGPLFTANNPGGNRIGSFGTANSYDDNSQGSLFSNASGYTSPSGDVLSYGGATGYDGYDSGAVRAEKQAQIDADQQERTQENIARMEEERKRREAEQAMQDLTEGALELASLGPAAPKPGDEAPGKPTNTKIVEIAPGVYVTVQDDNIEEMAPGQYRDKEQYDPAFDVPDEIERQYREQQERKASEETAEKTPEELFRERFGDVADGGYEFDNPYQDPNSGPEEKSPRDKAWDYYGEEMTSRGWEQYKDIPASQFNSLPDWVRNDPLFQNYKLYEYSLEHPNASAKEFGTFYRGLTGTQYDNDYIDTLLLDTLEDYRNNPTGWGAAGKGIVAGLNGLVDQLQAFEKSLPSGMSRQFSEHLGKMVLMSPQEREQYIDQVVLAPLRDKVDSAYKALDAIEYLTGTDMATKRADLAKYYESVRQDMLRNPEKYVEGGFEAAITVVADYAIGKKGAGLITRKSPDLPDSNAPSIPKDATDLADSPRSPDNRSDTGQTPSLDEGPKGRFDDAELVGKGGFGDVYDEGVDGKLTKKIKDEFGDKMPDIVDRQYTGYKNLDGTGIPRIEIYDVDRTNGTLTIQNVTDVGGGSTGAYVGKGGLLDLSPSEKQAYSQLLNQLDSNGLYWADAKPSNVFFFEQNGQLRAGVLDHDFLEKKSNLVEWSKLPENQLTPYQRDLVKGSTTHTQNNVMTHLMGTPDMGTFLGKHNELVSQGVDTYTAYNRAFIEVLGE